MTASILLRRLPAALLATSLAVACAAPAAAPSGPIGPGTDAAPREVNVIMRDYLFEPTPIRLVRGETVHFNIFNGGLLPHDFVLGDAPVQAAWASAESAATPDVITATQPPISLSPELAGLRVYLTSGQSASLVYRVPQDGELLLACHIPGHLERGMVGSIEFVPAASP